MNAFEKRNNLKASAALMAIALLAVVGALAFADESEATGEDLTGYGEVSEITIAPGYTWTYTATFPEDLTDGVVLTTAVNDLGAQLVSISGHTVTVTIPSGTAAGQYNMVLQADHAASGQTAYQWIRFTVNDAMSVDYSGLISEIILGTEQLITLSSTGGIGTVTWDTVSMPAGLTLIGSTVTGVPTTVGLNTIQLLATSSSGQTCEIQISFTVYNVIVGGDAETITSTGNYVSSSAVTQTGSDLNVTWRVTSGTLPSGFSLDSSTGVVSGTYAGTSPASVTVTITGTANNGPTQTATKEITIRGEPSFSLELDGDSTVNIYPGKGDTIVTVEPDADVTDITWSVSGMDGVTIDEDGNVTIPDDVGSGTVTVTGETEYGQEASVTITVVSESDLSITGPTTLTTTAGVSVTSSAYTITGGEGNTVAITDDGGFGSGVTWNSASNTLTVSYPEAHSGTVTITVTSSAGQTATIDVLVIVYTSLGFTSSPTADGIIAYTED